MSPPSAERSADILRAIDRCLSYCQYLASTQTELAAMAYDAVLRNLAVIGEAVRALPEDAASGMTDVPWAAIAGLRNVVVHEYFRVEPAVITDILDSQLSPLAARLREQRS